jgi:uncharacterized protein (DUF885 family)
MASNRNRCIAISFVLLLSHSSWSADAGTGAPRDKAMLSDLVDSYFEEFLRLNPVAATFIGDHRYDDRFPALGPADRKAGLQLAQKSLDALAGIDRANLNAANQLVYDVFAFDQRLAIEAAAYPSELLPLDQFNNNAVFFAELGSGTSAQPFRTVQDYDNFLARMAAFPAWADQAIAWMREGVRRGIVQPRVVMEGVLPQLDTLAGRTPEQSVFWQPVTAMPASFSDADRQRLMVAYRKAISQQVAPAYRRMHDYVNDEYLPKTRQTVTRRRPRRSPNCTRLACVRWHASTGRLLSWAPASDLRAPCTRSPTPCVRIRASVSRQRRTCSTPTVDCA